MILDEVARQVTDIDDHLRFAREVIGRMEAEPSVRAGLVEQLGAIQARRDDQTLYLAVIGEFSSGKSTFINALLRDNLLKTSALVATALPTYILHGPALEIDVSFLDKTHPRFRFRGDVQTVDWLTERSDESGGSTGTQLDIRAFVHAVTAEETVTRRLRDVRIRHPAGLLADGMAVIDTPGTNALSETHGAITRRVVEEEADVALICIPAITPLSKTLVGFLAGPLRPVLHRCLFVVTRMDQVRPSYQEALLRSVRDRLTAELEIETPLYPCSAQVVMDQITEEAPIAEEDADWGPRFVELEEQIRVRLRRERTLIIAERLLRLLDQLLHDLDSHLRARRDAYQRRQRAIEREILPDLSGFSQAQRTAAATALAAPLDRAKRDAEKAVETLKEETRTRVVATIRGAVDKDALKPVIEQRVPEILREQQEALRAKVATAARPLGTAAERAAAGMDDAFARAYARLQILRGEPAALDRALSSGFTVSETAIVATMTSLNGGFSNEGKIGAGVVVGGIIGSIFLTPGLGTAVGAAFGGWIGSLFGPSLDERKQKLIDAVTPKLDEAFDSGKPQVIGEVTKAHKSLVAKLNRRAAGYVSRYESTVDALLAEQERELAQINAEQVQVKADLEQIRRRRAAIARLQERLQRTGITRTEELVNVR